MERKDNEGKVVLTGTYKGSYENFRHLRVNKNNKISLNTIKLLFKRRKKNGYV
jgi:hypothetical protein